VDVVSTDPPGGTLGVGGSSGDSLVVLVREDNAAGLPVFHPYRIDFNTSNRSATTSGTASVVTVYDQGRCTTADAVVVPCDQPHGNEEYATFSVSESSPVHSDVKCAELFEQYSGLVYADVKDRFSILTATGGLGVRCYLAGPRGGGLDVRTESARRR